MGNVMVPSHMTQQQQHIPQQMSQQQYMQVSIFFYYDMYIQN